LVSDINPCEYIEIEMVSLETGIALIIIGIILLVLNRFVPSLPARLLYIIGSIVLVIGIIMVILYFVFGIV
jgi:membrane-bound ClpP family serine protease